MAIETGGTLVDVVRLPTMLVVHVALPVLMTGQAGKRGEITGYLMAVDAPCPLPIVRSAEDREEHGIMIIESSP